MASSTRYTRETVKTTPLGGELLQAEADADDTDTLEDDAEDANDAETLEDTEDANDTDTSADTAGAWWGTEEQDDRDPDESAEIDYPDTPRPQMARHGTEACMYACRQ